VPLVPPCERGALDGEIVRLAAAAREDDLARRAAEDGGDPLAGGVHRVAGPLRRSIDTGGVSKPLGEVGQHGGHDPRVAGGRRRMVEVDPIVGHGSSLHCREIYLRCAEGRPHGTCPPLCNALPYLSEARGSSSGLWSGVRPWTLISCSATRWWWRKIPLSGVSCSPTSRSACCTLRR